MKKYISVFLLAVFFLTSVHSFAWAAEDNQGEKELTIEQAVDLALANSKDLKKSKLSIASKEELLKLTQDNVKYTPAGSNTEEASRSAYNSYLTADMNLLISKKSKSTTEDQTVYSTLSAYIGVLNAIDNYNYAEANLKNEQKNINIARVSHQVGTVSKYELDQAEIKFKTAQKSQDSALIELNMAYITLNNLLGSNTQERPVLTETPAYSILETDDLEKHINRVIDENPQLAQAEKQAEIAVVQRDLMSYNSGTDNYYNRALEVDQANLTVTQTKENTRQTVRNVYNNILKMEEQYVSLQEGIKAAESALQLVQTRYDIGMATESEVYAKEVALLEAQKSLNSMIYQHELSKITYEKPWSAS